MADPRKTRVGQRVRASYRGRVVVGEFGGIIPAQPMSARPNERGERIVVKTPNMVTYLPLCEGTQFFHER